MRFTLLPRAWIFRAFAPIERPFTRRFAPLEIVSEASRRLPDDLLHRHPEIDWVAIAAAGNVYRHEYEAVDEALIWHTVQNSLAALRNVASEEFRRLQAPPRE